MSAPQHPVKLYRCYILGLIIQNLGIIITKTNNVSYHFFNGFIFFHLQETGASVNSHLKDYDEETFDDDDFYHQVRTRI